MIAAWPDLAERGRRLFGGGLRERSEQDEVVLLKPNHWGPAAFDSVRQELVQPIFDEEGRPMSLLLPHTPLTEKAIAILENQDPAQDLGFAGNSPPAPRSTGCRTGRPVPARRDHEFDARRPDIDRGHRGDTADAVEDVEEPAEADVGIAASFTPIGVMLTRLTEELETIAVGGIRSARNAGQLRRLAQQADSLGLMLALALLVGWPRNWTRLAATCGRTLCRRPRRCAVLRSWSSLRGRSGSCRSRQPRSAWDELLTSFRGTSL